MNEIAHAATAADPAIPLLEIDRVTLQYKTSDSLVTATQQVSFNVHPSDRYILLGPSGCGKSPLLKAIGGYLQPSSGAIRLKGREVHAPGPERNAITVVQRPLSAFESLYRLGWLRKTLILLVLAAI